MLGEPNPEAVPNQSGQRTPILRGYWLRHFAKALR
jgi:hypothetical protein